MDLLQQARQEIGAIDKEIAALFERRMHAAEKVAEYKKEHGMPIFDEEREKQLLEKNASLIQDENLKEYYVLFQKYIMEVSKKYQSKLLRGMRVAYSGTEGAFAQIAAQHVFPKTEIIGYENFSRAYEAVENGDCDCAVLPIENSYAGEVGQVMDLLFSGTLQVNGVYEQEIRQNLVGVPGTKLSEIQTVISHPQALNQCAKFLGKLDCQTRECNNTAMAAEQVAREGDVTVAAIASEETASLYGLEIIERNINDNQNNTTRFAVLSRTRMQAQNGQNQSILMFTVPNQAGALADAIQILGKHGYNITALRSRPMKKLLWEYYFYLEVDGDLRKERGASMLAELEKVCEDIKVVGGF